jgi:hypothetical protein
LIVFEVNLPAAYEPDAMRSRVSELGQRRDRVPDAPTIVGDHPPVTTGRHERAG